MKKIAFVLTIWLAIACGNSANKSESSVEMISAPTRQDSLFKNLLAITNTIPVSNHRDSLAFLILPVQASCPACRKKTIDSIIKHEAQLLPNHYIIITANGGRKLMSSYFKEENAELPDLGNQMFLDSNNTTFKYDLCVDKPTFYYAHESKVYKKVAAIPITVREDLREFFSGYRKKDIK